MELQISSIAGTKDNHIQVVAVGRDGAANIRLPLSRRKELAVNGKLLVTVVRPGFIGWLQRKLVGA